MGFGTTGRVPPDRVHDMIDVTQGAVEDRGLMRVPNKDARTGRTSGFIRPGLEQVSPVTVIRRKEPLANSAPGNPIRVSGRAA